MTPSVSSVPDATRGGSLRGDSAVRFASEAPTRAQFAAVPPPQIMGEVRGTDGRKRRAVGLLPAVAGAIFPLVIRDRPTDRVSPREVSQIKAELRKADAQATALESALVSVTASVGAQHPDALAKLAEARAAVDRAAIFRRRLAAAEESAKGRPTQVHLATVHEPAEVPDALASADSPPVVVCLHDGCRGQRWETEAEMRRAHPTNAEMARTQQAHVYCYLSEAPADPLDPDGLKIGYIAPIGRDGTTVQQAAEMGEDGMSNEDLRAIVAKQGEQIASLLALVEAGKPKKS